MPKPLPHLFSLLRVLALTGVLGGTSSCTLLTAAEGTAFIAPTPPEAGAAPWQDLRPASLTQLNLPNPYDIPGQQDVVHPSVVHVPSGWHGWTYWMVYTPYNLTQNKTENPSVAVSNSPAGPWVAPPGVHNPLFSPSTTGHYSDPDLFLDPDTDQLVLVWRGSWTGEGKGTDCFYYATSKDGIHWSQKVLWSQPKQRLVSPSIVQFAGRWMMFVTQISRAPHTTKVAVAERWQDLVSQPLTPIEPQWTPDHRRLWHANVEVVEGHLLLIGSVGGLWGGPVWMAASSDPAGLNWTWAHEPVLRKNGYRSAVLPISTPEGTRLNFWLGSRDWKIYSGQSAGTGF